MGEKLGLIHAAVLLNRAGSLGDGVGAERSNRTQNESSPINLEARFAATLPIQTGSHHQRPFGSGVVVQHGSHEDPGVPSSRGQS